MGTNHLRHAIHPEVFLLLLCLVLQAINKLQVITAFSGTSQTCLQTYKLKHYKVQQRKSCY